MDHAEQAGKTVEDRLMDLEMAVSSLECWERLNKKEKESREEGETLETVYIWAALAELGYKKVPMIPDEYRERFEKVQKSRNFWGVE